MEDLLDIIENGKMIEDKWDENMRLIVDETKKVLIKLTWNDEKVENKKRNWVFTWYFKY